MERLSHCGDCYSTRMDETAASTGASVLAVGKGVRSTISTLPLPNVTMSIGGASSIATDPFAENYRARRAYSRAGFVEDRVASTADGLVAVMTFERSQPN